MSYKTFLINKHMLNLPGTHVSLHKPSRQTSVPELHSLNTNENTINN